MTSGGIYVEKALIGLVGHSASLVWPGKDGFGPGSHQQIPLTLIVQPAGISATVTAFAMLIRLYQEDVVHVWCCSCSKAFVLQR